MDALRYSKKTSLLAVAILFLFTFFNLILDARTLSSQWLIKAFRQRMICKGKCRL
jgi:hypothetical protein